MGLVCFEYFHSFQNARFQVQLISRFHIIFLVIYIFSNISNVCFLLYKWLVSLAQTQVVATPYDRINLAYPPASYFEGVITKHIIGALGEISEKEMLARHITILLWNHIYKCIKACNCFVFINKGELQTLCEFIYLSIIWSHLCVMINIWLLCTSTTVESMYQTSLWWTRLYVVIDIFMDDICFFILRKHI